MADYSIISCVSRQDVYESCLLESVRKQQYGRDVEIIPILNIHSLYSASMALNHGIDVARSNTLIFAHQDVYLLDGWFDSLDEHLRQKPSDCAIIGSAGIDLRYGRADIGYWGGSTTVDTVAVGRVWDSLDKIDQTPYWNGNKDLTRSHCADECLFVLDKRTNLRFDLGYTGFHFYGVDICLQARAAGYGVYCGDLPIVHDGRYSASYTADRRYWTYLRYLHNKWRYRFPEFLGTHMHWAADELTSYIPMKLVANTGTNILVKSMSINKFKLRKEHVDLTQTIRHCEDG